MLPIKKFQTFPCSCFPPPSVSFSLIRLEKWLKLNRAMQWFKMFYFENKKHFWLDNLSFFIFSCRIKDSTVHFIFPLLDSVESSFHLCFKILICFSFIKKLNTFVSLTFGNVVVQWTVKFSLNYFMLTVFAGYFLASLKFRIIKVKLFHLYWVLICCWIKKVNLATSCWDQ